MSQMSHFQKILFNSKNNTIKWHLSDRFFFLSWLWFKRKMYETVNMLLHLQLASICVTWDGDWVRPPAVRQWWQHLGLQTAASLTVIQHCSIDWRKDWKLQYGQEQFLKNCKRFFVLEVKCKQTPLDVLLFCAEWVACKSSCRSFFMFYSIWVELSAKKTTPKKGWFTGFEGVLTGLW